MSRTAWLLPTSTISLLTAPQSVLWPVKQSLLNMAGNPWGQQLNQDGSYNSNYPYTTAANPIAGIRTVSLDAQSQHDYSAYCQAYQNPSTLAVAQISHPLYNYASYGAASTSYVQPGANPAYQPSNLYMQQGYISPTAGHSVSPQQTQPLESSQMASSAQYHDEAAQEEPPKELRCYDHGCNGRAFSTHSNLLRHQREKSGNSMKYTCPKCGAQFTRNTAMKAHMDDDKCGKKRGSGFSHRRSP